MTADEIAVRFPCKGAPLVGIVHPANRPARIGVVVVVGGPQYRIGSHRQFVLLARALAAAGIPAFRFDVRGMGDSGGHFPGFQAINDDIAAAIDTFTAAVPGLDHVVLWGLCDAASANLFYAYTDSRVAGLVLLNPWVRTETTYARAELKHYYLGKMVDGGFWRRLLTRKVAIREAALSFWQRVHVAALRGRATSHLRTRYRRGVDPATPLPNRMAQGLAAFGGPVLLIISGNDLTAREFEDVAKASPQWTGLLARQSLLRRDLKAADHTFSRSEWTETVNAWTIEWVAGLNRADQPHHRESAVSSG